MECLYLTEGQRYFTGLLWTGRPGSPGQATSTAAEIFPGEASSATETVPS